MADVSTNTCKIKREITHARTCPKKKTQSEKPSRPKSGISICNFQYKRDITHSLILEMKLLAAYQKFMNLDVV